MKIQIDTTNKTIKLDSKVELKELIETLDKLFPRQEWKEFTLESSVVFNNWNTPIIIENNNYPVTPNYPWYSDGSTTGINPNVLLCSGTYNVEVN